VKKSTQKLATGAATRLAAVFVSAVLVIGLLLGSGVLSPGGAAVRAAGRPLQPQVPQQHTIYLPALTQVYMSPMVTIFGVDLGAITPLNGQNQMRSAGAHWVRRGPIEWLAVEPTEPLSDSDRNWAALAGFEAELLNASRSGMQVIVIVGGTPAWAQKSPGYTCGAIKEDKLPAFASFMHALVSRYSAPPYNVKHWELYNEPDISPEMLKDNPESPYGCWGDSNDPYFGGGYYADMLAAVYPSVKSADPEAAVYPSVKSADPESQVLVGGLLLDCDPTLTGACPEEEEEEKSKVPPRFLEGILRHNGANDGGNYFDGVSFHAYDYSACGSFGAAGKFLMNTEAALICGDITDPPGEPGCEPDAGSPYEQTKASYVAQVYTVAKAKDLRANIWYSVFGWRNSGLLNDDLSTRPAYQAYVTAWKALAGASFSQEITQYPSVQGYAFDKNGQTVWVLWSADGADQSVNLAATPVKIYGPRGDALAVSATITVGAAPVYIEW